MYKFYMCRNVYIHLGTQYYSIIMGNLNATEQVLADFKNVVFQRYGKLHGTLKKEVDIALQERAEKLLRGGDQ